MSALDSMGKQRSERYIMSNTKSNTNQHGNCELKDEEIFENEIKCITRRNECVCNGGSDCAKCDLLMESEEILKCYNRAIKNIDLINRQKAEIERLKTGLIVVTDELTSEIINAKFEAIKEFWDKLKQKKQWDVDMPDYIFVADGDNLVKEMAGE